QAFAHLGMEDEERWRAAARIRASFAHASAFTAPYSWLRDPDVAWVIGVNQHKGVSYVVKEQLERLLWWMGLRILLDAAGTEPQDGEKLRILEHQIETRMRAAEAGNYRTETLEEALPLGAKESRS